MLPRQDLCLPRHLRRHLRRALQIHLLTRTLGIDCCAPDASSLGDMSPCGEHFGDLQFACWYSGQQAGHTRDCLGARGRHTSLPYGCRWAEGACLPGVLTQGLLGLSHALHAPGPQTLKGG